MKFLRVLFFRIFKVYRRLELRCVPWAYADVLMRQNPGEPECEQWVIAPEEHTNRHPMPFMVFIERRERITS